MYLRRLCELRKDRGLRQQDIADFLGMHRIVYARYERGYRSIPVEYLAKLADLYHVSLDYLLEREDR